LEKKGGARIKVKPAKTAIKGRRGKHRLGKKFSMGNGGGCFPPPCEAAISVSNHLGGGWKGSGGQNVGGRTDPGRISL